jgi:transcriptional regulator with XRE-family HTH domain
MTNIKSITLKLKALRVLKGIKVNELAQKLGVDQSYVSKIESAQVNISMDLILRIMNVLDLNTEERASISKELSLKSDVTNLHTDREAVNQPMIQDNKIDVILPDNINILYSNSMWVSSDEFGIVLDFGQKTQDPTKHIIVTRVGISKEHAKKILEALKKHTDGTLQSSTQQKIIA